MHHHPHHPRAGSGGAAGQPHRHHPIRRTAGGRQPRGSAPTFRPAGFHPGGNILEARRQLPRRRQFGCAGIGGMKPPAAGSALWLLRHELRLQWRTAGKKVNVAVMAAVVLVFLHLVAFPLAFVVRYLPPPATVLIYETVTGAALFAFLMMMSTALVAAVQAIFARGDIDLLLSSPVP